MGLRENFKQAFRELTGAENMKPGDGTISSNMTNNAAEKEAEHQNAEKLLQKLDEDFAAGEIAKAAENTKVYDDDISPKPMLKSPEYKITPQADSAKRNRTQDLPQVISPQSVPQSQSQPSARPAIAAGESEVRTTPRKSLIYDEIDVESEFSATAELEKFDSMSEKFKASSKRNDSDGRVFLPLGNIDETQGSIDTKSFNESAKPAELTGDFEIERQNLKPTEQIKNAPAGIQAINKATNKDNTFSQKAYSDFNTTTSPVPPNPYVNAQTPYGIPTDRINYSSNSREIRNTSETTMAFAKEASFGNGSSPATNGNSGRTENSFGTPAGTPRNDSSFGGSNSNSDRGFFGGLRGSGGSKSNNSRNQNSNEITIISRNTIIDGNIRSFANIDVQGDVKGNVETTKNTEVNGRISGDITCNNSIVGVAQIQGNMLLKGSVEMNSDAVIIGNLDASFADLNGKIKGNVRTSGQAQFKADSVVFGDITASTITVDDGAIIQGYVNTTFLSKDEGRSIFPDKIMVGEF